MLFWLVLVFSVLAGPESQGTVVTSSRHLTSSWLLSLAVRRFTTSPGRLLLCLSSFPASRWLFLWIDAAVPRVCFCGLMPPYLAFVSAS